MKEKKVEEREERMSRNQRGGREKWEGTWRKREGTIEK